ncbi:hypothetical protein FK521_27520, partial [Klebsiella pneumoniae]|nr:hypothetical protein [Klebsiella pneumoniae]
SANTRRRKLTRRSTPKSLSDRIGRRPVMLTGVVWFIVTCLATLLAQTIEQFTLLRFLQVFRVMNWAPAMR